MHKYVYDISEGSSKMVQLLGGKGAHLSEMKNIGLPIPSAFVISSYGCRSYLETGKFPEGLWDQILAGVSRLEKQSKRYLGDSEQPLLVSVRSSGAVSMPGMMDTILNLGINPTIVDSLCHNKENRIFSLDICHRFLEMFTSSVYEINPQIEKVKDHLVSPEKLWLAADEAVGPERKIPTDPYEQLYLAVEAVFRSWSSRRAKTYRRHRKIPESNGTAVVVQQMVFGNLDLQSGTGVMFSRNPLNGEREIYGDFMAGVQGEEIVSGQSTPTEISQLSKFAPEIYSELKAISDQLEKHYRDIQDIEFTVESGKLYILQTRAAKRTAEAAVRTAVEMVEEGLISQEEALLRVSSQQIAQLSSQSFDDEKKREAIASGRLLATGLPACPGSASGRLVFDSSRAVDLAKEGKNVILARPETSPHDIEGMIAAEGIITTLGGPASHAAVVARELDTPCVVGLKDGHFIEEGKLLKIGKLIFNEDDLISLDGTTGQIFNGEILINKSNTTDYLDKFLSWSKTEAIKKD